MSDQYSELVERVQAAGKSGEPLNIIGGSSKHHYGGPPAGEPLSMTDIKGVIEYDPAELIITARAGTPLAEIETLLAESGQMLGFEPPLSIQGATLGGAISTGLAGAGRPWRGGVRDFLLGIRMINGRGEVVHFGGQVMKNVAGFDLFRPMAGAMGTLGVLLEVSLRVIPVPEHQQSLKFVCDSQAKIISEFSRFGQYLPTLSAASWQRGTAHVRLSGSALAVKRDRAIIDQDYATEETDASHWELLSCLENPFFTQTDARSCLAAIDLPPATPPISFPGEQLIDWGGARRYLKTSLGIKSIREIAETVGGSATALRGAPRSEFFHPLAPGLMEVHSRLKKAFDPYGIFNPGRLYHGL